jgi:hypothetical protein
MVAVVELTFTASNNTIHLFLNAAAATLQAKLTSPAVMINVATSNIEALLMLQEMGFSIHQQRERGCRGLALDDRDQRSS